MKKKPAAQTPAENGANLQHPAAEGQATAAADLTAQAGDDEKMQHPSADPGTEAEKPRQKSSLISFVEYADGELSLNAIKRPAQDALQPQEGDKTYYNAFSPAMTMPAGLYMPPKRKDAVTGEWRDEQPAMDILLSKRKADEPTPAELEAAQVNITEQLAQHPIMQAAAEDARQHAAQVEAMAAQADSMETERMTDDIDSVQPTAEEEQEALRKLYDELKGALIRWAEFVKSDEMAQLREVFTDFDAWLRGTAPQRNIADLIFFTDVFDSMKPVMPFLIEEVKALQSQPGMESLTFAEFMRNVDPETMTPIESHFMRVLKRARGRQEESAEITKAIEALPKIEKITAKWYVSPNNRLANELTKLTAEEVAGQGAAFDLVVMNRGKPSEVTASTLITLETDENITFSGKPYTQYDRAVHDGVVSLYCECKRRGLPPIITPLKVYQIITGNASDNDSPSPQRMASITKSLEKMRRGIRVKVDATEEMQRRRITDDEGNPITRFVLDDTLLSLRGVEAKAGNKEVKAYMITAEPLLYSYSRTIGQVLTAPAAILNIKDGTGATIANTDSRISIKTYLWQRIAVMKHDEQEAAEALRKHNDRRRKDKSIEEKPLAAFRKQSRTILFETLFKESGQETTDRRTQMKNRDFTTDVLQYWKQAGYIKDYEQQTKGRAIIGVTITV